MKNCAAFDKKLMAEAEAAGGRKYAELCALAYRQALAAHNWYKLRMVTWYSFPKRISVMVPSNSRSDLSGSSVASALQSGTGQSYHEPYLLL